MRRSIRWMPDGPTAAMSLLAAIVLALSWRLPLEVYDEGLALVGGLRLLRGEVPFKDFAAVYPPGAAYALAGVFRVFGVSVAAERGFDLVVRFSLVLALYATLRHLPIERWRAATLSVVAALLLASVGFFGYTTFPALLGVFVSVASWLRFHGGGGRPWLLTAGVAAGATTTMSVDLGAVAICALGSAIVLAHLWGSRDRVRARMTGDVLLWSAGVASVAVPVWGWWVSRAGSEVWRQIWAHILIFRETRARALPGPLPPWADWSACDGSLWCLDLVWGGWLRFYLPLVLLIMLLAPVVSRLCRRGDPRQALVPSLLAMLAAGLYMKALTRYDIIHALPVLLALLPAIGVLLERSSPKRRGIGSRILRAGVIGAGAVVYVVLPGATLASQVRVYPPYRCHAGPQIASCVPLWDQQAQVLTAIDEHVPVDAPLFVGLKRNDRVFANDISLYFFAQRPVPTRHHELDPGVADTEAVQRTIVGELQSGNVEWIVVVEYPMSNEPNAASRSSGVVLLDAFVAEHYAPVAAFGRYELRRRCAAGTHWRCVAQEGTAAP